MFVPDTPKTSGIHPMPDLRGFEDLGLVRIEIVVPTGNAASLRVAEKVGARREGVLRSRLLVGDTPEDGVMFSLVPGDLRR